MVHVESRTHHCSTCPHRAGSGELNPHVCVWTNVDGMPERRKKVIVIVEQLMQNNQHPWCGFDRKFRWMVVRSALRSVKEHLETDIEKRQTVTERRVYRKFVMMQRAEFLPHHNEEVIDQPVAA